MSYQKTNWENFPSIKTQINAENLNKMEEGIYEAHQSFDNIPEWSKQPEKPTYTAEEVGSLDESGILKLAITPTATGTQIVARDTAEWPIHALTVYGRSEQAKTTGAQLIDFSRAVYQRCALVDAKTGTIKSNINNEYFCTIYVNYLADYFMANLGKAISLRADNNPNYISIIIYGERTSGGTVQEISTQGTRTSITIAEDFTSINQVELRVNRKPTEVFTDTTSLISGLMLYEGSEEKAFEPYTGGKPAPSPDYPQPIVSAGERLSTGAQLFDVSKAIIHEAPVGLAISLNKDVYTVKGTADKASGMYSFNFVNTNDTSLAGKGYIIQAFDATGTTIKSIYGLRTETETAIAIGFDTTQSQDIEVSFRVMVSKERATTYEPYTGGVPAAYPVGIEVAISGKNFVPQNAEYRKNFSVSLKANDTVTCSAIVTSSSPIDHPGGIRFYFADGTEEGFFFTGKSNNRSSRTTTLKKDVVNAMFDYGECCDFQIELGSSATAYEPYRGRQTVTLASTNGLPGIPVSSGGNYTDADGQQWVCDTIEYRGGQAVYVKRVWSKTFTGGAGEYWSIYNTANYEGFASNCLPENYRRAPGFCNLLTVHAGATHQGEDGLWLGVDNKLVYNHNSRFYDTTLEDKGLANWKAYLAAHPMTVMTYLTTPVETPLTDAEAAQLAALHTYKPTTTITNDAGAGMEVGYVADTKAYIDNKFAELQAAQAITNAQLI